MKRLFSILLLCLIPMSLWAQVTEESVETAFNKKPPVKKRGWTCDAITILIGDLNGDGQNDGLVQYHFHPRESGNATHTIGWAVYLNQRNQPTYALHDSKRVPWVIEKIRKDGIIEATRYDYADSDGHCCPSIKTPHLAKFTPTKFVILK